MAKAVPTLVGIQACIIGYFKGLDIKYLMFDLEVTRRERDELKKGLEE